jgi:hypothetical protein
MAGARSEMARRAAAAEESRVEDIRFLVNGEVIGSIKPLSG